ncbi:MAG: peptide-methionine (R)-S-oxide reductase MsrB [Candidatus Andeanibacterium colombiense]|uniref:peptide-methionine (R)-S-oxide reductase n=1 Tax=Candidatus Andeanibacterium colombiense TaxID=3121345 RepID=A0AAJ6BN78_9SPHN|nr:MAG: peptide-methionine (R)-S-oxide reductase MsrB [Sphingomonadaceae bacterium]
MTHLTPSRRALLGWLGTSAALSAFGVAPAFAAYRVTMSDAEWRKKLGDASWQVLRHEDTERPFTSPLNNEHRKGTFLCKGCDNQLFASGTKFDSHTGWPSFWQPLSGAVKTTSDTKLGYVRTEVHCADCGGHLGHVFPDGPKPTGLRYCMNGLAMNFRPG